MSVLIKGMEMPKGCCDCNNFVRFAWSDKGQIMSCYATHKEITVTEWKKVKGYKVEEFLNNRPDWCPLIEVPTPHGDLVDLSDMVRPNDSMRLMTIDEQLRRTCERWSADRKQYVVIEAERNNE